MMRRLFKVMPLNEQTGSNKAKVVSGTTAVAGLILMLLITSVAVAARVTIDNFDDGTQNLEIVCFTGPECAAEPFDSSIANGSVTNILGGQREVSLAWVGGRRNEYANVDINDGGSGLLSFTQDPDIQSDVVIVWDGPDGITTTIDTTGLDGVDLTDGNTNSGFQITVPSSFVLTPGNLRPIDVHLSVISDTNRVTQTVSITDTILSSSGGRSYFIPFTDYGAFDLTNVGAVVVTIESNDKDNDIQLEMIDTTVDFDWGDLPAAYDDIMLAVNNGGRHQVTNLFLGSNIDREPDGQTNASALGDDDDALADEAGVLRVGQWADGENGATLSVSVTGGAGCLSGWIDWLDDGDFTDTGLPSGAGTADDQVIAMQPVSTAGSPQTFTLNVPDNTFDGASSVALFARFRLMPDTGTVGDCSDEAPLGLGGLVIGGEVEDFLWSFSPTAVSLQDFSATTQSNALLLLAVVGLAAILTGAVFLIRRRPR